MEYRSRISFLGLPLVHVATAKLVEGVPRRSIARGWIAVGDIAFGAICVGGIAAGGVALGGLTLGLVPIGGLALGGLAIGGLAVGIAAFGGGAVAWHAALGGLAVARDFALGGAAFAAHANDALAQQYFRDNPLFSAIHWGMDHSQWLVLLAVLPALLALWRRRERAERGPDKDR